MQSKGGTKHNGQERRTLSTWLTLSQRVQVRKRKRSTWRFAIDDHRKRYHRKIQTRSQIAEVGRFLQLAISKNNDPNACEILIKEHMK